MSKQLYLIRHADAEVNYSIDDFDRKLSPLGQRELNWLRNTLLKKGFSPQLILCSPATRTMQTCKFLAESLMLPLNRIQPEIGMFDAYYSTLLNIVNHIPEPFEQVALIGHNPGISELMGYLTGSSLRFLGTAGVVKLEFDFPAWDHISQGTGIPRWSSGPFHAV